MPAVRFDEKSRLCASVPFNSIRAIICPLVSFGSLRFPSSASSILVEKSPLAKVHRSCAQASSPALPVGSGICQAVNDASLFLVRAVLLLVLL